jgi:hypothetical protein
MLKIIKWESLKEYGFTKANLIRYKDNGNLYLNGLSLNLYADNIKQELIYSYIDWCSEYEEIICKLIQKGVIEWRK